MSEKPAAEAQRRAVRERYADIASTPAARCCDAGAASCCGDDGTTNATPTGADRLGYSAEEVAAVPTGADLGLGCGNPTAIASLRPGETVLDLGSGGGFDCFLAARQVGPEGRVIGVDMTPEMVARARANADRGDASNVEFRLGEIEHLPVADERVVISNCVINLSPDKPRVFREAFRVLEPGGRLAVTDVVSTAPLPPEVRRDPASLSACVAGAATVDDFEAMLVEAGFVDVRVVPEDGSRGFIREWDPDRDLSDFIVAAVVEGRKAV